MHSLIAATSAKAQEICETYSRNRSNDDFLHALRTILAKEGKLSIKLIDGTPATPNRIPLGRDLQREPRLQTHWL